MAEADFQKVADVADLVPGEVLHLQVAGHEVALFNLDGQFFATSDRCTHMRARLSDGYVEGNVVECPLHFGKFDIRSGKALSPPCKIDLATYAVEVRGDEVWVFLPG